MKKKIINSISETELVLLELTAESMTDANNSKRQGMNQFGSYSFITSSMTTLYNALLELKGMFDTKDWSFVDFGCGPGLTVYIAERLGFKAKGFEIQDNLIWTGNNKLKVKVEKADLTNSQLYVKELYDVCYFYRPFCDRRKEEEFEKNVQLSLKKGGILIPMGGSINHLNKMFKPIRLKNMYSVYQKL